MMRVSRARGRGGARAVEAAQQQGDALRAEHGSGVVPASVHLAEQVIRGLALMSGTDSDKAAAALLTQLRAGDTLSRDGLDLGFDFDAGGENTTTWKSTAADDETVITFNAASQGYYVDTIQFRVLQDVDQGTTNDRDINPVPFQLTITGSDSVARTIQVGPEGIELDFGAISDSGDSFTVTYPDATDTEVAFRVLVNAFGVLPKLGDLISTATGNAKPEDYEGEDITEKLGKAKARRRGMQRAKRVAKAGGEAPAIRRMVDQAESQLADRIRVGGPITRNGGGAKRIRRSG